MEHSKCGVVMEKLELYTFIDLINFYIILHNIILVFYNITHYDYCPAII